MFDLRIKYTPVDMDNDVLFANDLGRRSFVQNGNINGFKNNDRRSMFMKERQLWYLSSLLGSYFFCLSTWST